MYTFSVILHLTGYHWDTSDWVPVREEGGAVGGASVGGAPDVRGRRGDADGYHVARLLVSL